MRDFNTKIDNDSTSAGVVVADEYNSIFSEAKGAVTPFMWLNEADTKQLAKSIDIASKAMFYTDTGTPNAVILERGATTETLETLFDGMVIYFVPANANTGATTLKVKTLASKPLFYNGADLPAGYLNTTSKYVAVYDVTNDRFNVDVIAGGSAKQPYKVADAVNDDEAVSKGQSKRHFLETHSNGNIALAGATANKVPLEIIKDSSVGYTSAFILANNEITIQKSGAFEIYFTFFVINMDANAKADIRIYIYDASADTWYSYRTQQGGEGNGQAYGNKSIIRNLDAGDIIKFEINPADDATLYGNGTDSYIYIKEV